MVVEITKLFTVQAQSLVAPLRVLRSDLSHQAAQVEAAARKFEVNYYGKKEEEVVYDPKGEPSKGTKAPFNHIRSCKEGIHLPWIYCRGVNRNATMAI
jgi:hypothetical protein